MRQASARRTFTPGRCRRVCGVVGIVMAVAPWHLAWAETITVALDGSGDYSAIQPAIDAADPGDTVLVRPGVYVTPVSISFGGKPIVVRGEGGAEVTVIERATEPTLGTVVYFTNGESAEARLEGFTLRGGDGEMGVGGILFGPGCSAVVSHCVISGNSGAYGGGLHFQGGSAATVSHCTISENFGVLGGGAYFGPNSSAATLVDCAIVDNSAYNGGGVYCERGSAVLTRCTISANYARFGGGMDLHNSSSVTLKGCILWDTEGVDGLWLSGEGDVFAEYSCVETGEVWPGEGNINSNPLFCSSDDFRLQPGSPCIGAGVDGASMGAPLGLCDEETVLLLRGDANDDGTANLSDAVFVLAYLFSGGTKPGCLDAADTDDDGEIILTDAVYLLAHLFQSAPEPPSPYPDCGVDPTGDSLSCEAAAACAALGL